MTALELTAIRTLPSDYIRDGTQFAIYSKTHIVVALHPDLPPIKWIEAEGWTKLEFAELPQVPRSRIIPVEP
jgi:hypothetical protein